VKKRVTIGLLILALLLVAVGMVASVAGAGSVIGNIGQPDKVATIDQTFAVTGVPTVSVENHNGNVTITRGGGNSVIIHATKRATTNELLNKLQVNLRQDGDRITVRTSGDTFSGFVFFGSRTAVDYEIQVPSRTDLAPLTNSNGRIEVNGIAGRLDLHSSNGLITARDVDGTVTAQTSNGRVIISGGRGMLACGTGNGTVEIQNVQADGLDLHSANGRISFLGSLTAGSKNRMETSNGTVTVTLPPDAGVAVDLRAGNGSVHVTGFTVTTAPNGARTRDAVRGVINRPAADLTVRTGNGSITLNTQGV